MAWNAGMTPELEKAACELLRRRISAPGQNSKQPKVTKKTDEPVVMARRAATITQVEIRRAIRAAKQEGWRVVRLIMPGGVVVEISETPAPLPEEPEEDFEL